MLFGKKRKAQVHSQALMLMNEWNQMVTAAGNLTFGMSEDEMENIDEDKIMSLATSFSMALLGILTYMVAGLNHVDTAQEMVEIFKNIFSQYPKELNPEGLSVNEAANKVNSYYQKATAVSESLMEQGKGLADITRAHAEEVFKWIKAGASEEDISFVENCLNVFYKETYEKYYG